jgi:hypothetical protein
MSAASICAIALAVGLYAYLYFQAGGVADKAVAARDDLQKGNAGQTALKNVRSVAEATAAERAELSSYLIPSNNAVSFIQALESIGPASGARVTISSISDSNLDSAAPGTIGAISASIAASGSWGSVMRTLRLLETLPYQSSIDSVTLSAGGMNPSDAKTQPVKAWQLSLTVSALAVASQK